MPMPLPPLAVLLPLASMIVSGVLAPISDRGLLMTACSRYVPGATWTVSPGAAADTPALIVLKQPGCPLVPTQMVAAEAEPTVTAENATHSTPSRTRSQAP